MTRKDLIEPKRLKGFRDYLPDLMAARYGIMDVIRAEARLAGFQVIGTPALEYATTLVGQGSDETDKQVYRFKDHGDRDVALRFDLTVPFARFVAEHQNDLAFPFKKLQMGDVWRGENTQKGRYREFAQCDLDIIGVDSPYADVEILAVFQKILGKLDCGPFTMAIGNRVLLSALIRHFLGDVGASGETTSLIAIDKLAKIGPEKVAALLEAIPGARAGGAPQLLQQLTAKDAAGDTDLGAIEAVLSDEPAKAEIKRLREILAAVRTATKGGRGKVVLDLTTARGLGYYTGIVFETTLDELPGFGSVCSGGRYNDLLSRFTTRELPGIGGSIGLDRLLAGLEELGRIPSGKGRMVFVAVATTDAYGYGYEIVTALRALGVAADLGLAAKLGNQFKHADRLGCPYVLTVGSSEKDSRTYALKSMGEGTERRDLPVGELKDEMARLGLL